MRRIETRAVLLKRRVKLVQRKAILAGLLYLTGTLVLLALSCVFPMVLGTGFSDGSLLPILTFYKPIFELIEGDLKNWTVELVINALVATMFMITVLIKFIGFAASCTKLGWLFKRRASYANGFNRNMYAMDYMANRYASSFGGFTCITLITYLLVDGAKLSTFAFLTFAVGLLFHFVAGIIGGTVTVFTSGDHIEEEEREHGIAVYVVRNIIQLAAVAAITFFLAKESVLGEFVLKILDMLLISKTAFTQEVIMEMIYPATELLLWVCILVLITHATAETEFNRDCMAGVGMRNFAIFSMFAFLLSVGLVALPFAGMGLAGAEAVLNKSILIVAAIALVAFILDLIVRSYQRGTYDEVDMEQYIREGDPMQYNY